MIQSTVLLTGAGGAALPSMIDRLHAKKYRVVAVDADPNAAGLYLADRGYRVPLAADPAFPDALRAICHAERVVALVPLVDEELLPVARLAEEEGVALIAPHPAFTALCLDKYALMRRLADVGLPVPETRLLREGWDGMPFPLILKPRTGRGSRGVRVVATPDELENYLATVRLGADATLIQRCVEGTEYTVSVVVWRDGMVRAVVPKQIIDKRGITRLAVTRKNDAIDRLCRNIQEQLRADGPFNVQLRLDASGVPLPFEINPRFSTTVTLTQAAGIDELGLLVDMAFGRTVSAESWNWREGVTLVRRTVDAFLTVGEYTARRKTVEQGP